MTLYFAYGSNMCRTQMRRRCPNAIALGPAVLADWRFVVTIDGWASIASQPGAVVHGVLWQLSLRDVGALNGYESVASGLYRPHRVPVRTRSGRVPALIYRGRSAAEGRPRPGYLALVVAAARSWDLPASYVANLERWSPSRWRRGQGGEAEAII